MNCKPNGCHGDCQQGRLCDDSHMQTRRVILGEWSKYDEAPIPLKGWDLVWVIVAGVLLALSMGL